MEITNGANLYLKQLGEQRPRIADLNPSIFPEGGPEPTSLVEISGVRRSGKTLLLMRLVAQYLTRCDIIFLNVSHKIDVQVLGRLVREAVQTANPNATATQLQDEFEKCMNSLEIIDCFSSQQIELALKALDQFMLLDNERISLIVVDALCEFYWHDLKPDERQRKYTYYMNWLAQLKKICNRFYVSCIYTIDSTFNRNQYASSRSVLIEHKLYLDYSKNGLRTLNNKIIYLNENGVQIKEQ